MSSIELIIANTINETAQGDPDALAARIVAALTEAGYRIRPRASLISLLEDSVREGSAQPFDELTKDARPQDPHGDGRDWIFETDEHGGDEPDAMPQAIEATDVEGRRAIYVPLTRGGKIVVPRAEEER